MNLLYRNPVKQLSHSHITSEFTVKENKHYSLEVFLSLLGIDRNFLDINPNIPLSKRCGHCFLLCGCFSSFGWRNPIISSTSPAHSFITQLSRSHSKDFWFSLSSSASAMWRTLVFSFFTKIKTLLRTVLVDEALIRSSSWKCPLQSFDCCNHHSKRFAGTYLVYNLRQNLFAHCDVCRGVRFASPYLWL